jgi:hypothetical protein
MSRSHRPSVPLSSRDGTISLTDCSLRGDRRARCRTVAPGAMMPRGVLPSAWAEITPGARVAAPRWSPGPSAKDSAGKGIGRRHHRVVPFRLNGLSCALSREGAETEFDWRHSVVPLSCCGHDTSARCEGRKGKGTEAEDQSPRMGVGPHSINEIGAVPARLLTQAYLNYCGGAPEVAGGFCSGGGVAGAGSPVAFPAPVFSTFFFVGPSFRQ